VIKVDLRDVSPVKKSMSVEVAPDAVEREARALLRDYAHKARIPGFRKGKVPLEMVRARFAKDLDDDLRERVVTRYYREAAREQGVEPLGNPTLDEVVYAEGEPLRFRTTFEVRPKIEPQAYRGIEVRRRTVRVDAAEVERMLEQLRQSRATLVAVADPAAKAALGHVVVADVAGTPHGGEAFRRERTMIELGAPDNLPAFNERLLDVQAGEAREFAVDYPAEYPVPALAGRSVDYRVHVHEIKLKDVPALDDEFARDVGEFADLAALRQRIEQDLRERQAKQVERDLRQGLVDKLLLENPVVLPDVLVEDELRRRLEDFVRGLILQGVDPQKLELDWEQLRKQQEEPARKTVHARLVLDAVAAAEALRVDDDELRSRIRDDAERAGQSPDKLRHELEKHGGREALRTQLLREKALDLLTSVANIQSEE